MISMPSYPRVLFHVICHAVTPLSARTDLKSRPGLTLRRRMAASFSTKQTFKKILAANRGEIAIRIMRAATELNIRTTGIFAHEDRYCPHRFKADEAYQVCSAHFAASLRLPTHGTRHVYAGGQGQERCGRVLGLQQHH